MSCKQSCFPLISTYILNNNSVEVFEMIQSTTDFVTEAYTHHLRNRGNTVVSVSGLSEKNRFGSGAAS